MWIATSAPATGKALVPHRNAPLTETGRLRLAPLCRRGRLASAAGGRALPGLTNDSPAMGGPLPAVWRGGHGGPVNRPHTSPRRTPTRTERRIIQVRNLRRWGPARIAHLLSLNSRPEASCSRSVRRRSAGVVRVCSVRTGPSGAVRRTRRPRRFRRPDRVSRARCVHLSRTARRVQERVLRGDDAAQQVGTPKLRRSDK